MEPFNPDTAQIGGMAVISIHLTIMSQIKLRLPAKLKPLFDLLNYPLAFVEMLLVLPPWPYWEYGSWNAYVGGSLALGALASITAKKIKDTDTNETNSTSP